MDNLSQDELDALIDEVTEESEGTAPEKDSVDDSEIDGMHEAHAEVERIVQAFDFNQPFSLSRGFERTLRNICENFAKIASLGFTNLMRTTAAFTFAGLKLTGFGELVAGLENPSCLSVASLKPLKGAVLVSFDAGIMFSLFTKLLGGPIEEASQIRDFTDIEMGMAQRIVDRVLENLQAASERIVALTPELRQMENNPSYLNAFSEGESVVCLEFAIAIEEVRGSLLFVIPLAAFEPVLDVFDPKEGLEIRSPADKARDRGRIARALGDASAEVVARFSPRHIRLKELLELEHDDVLQLGHPVDHPLTLMVEGKAMFDTAAGRSGQNRAIRIVKRREVR